MASFERVLDGLGEEEKYNAVLQGLSNLIISERKTAERDARSFDEVFALLDEMRANKIKCTTRTASAVVDAAAATANVTTISRGEITFVCYGNLSRSLQSAHLPSTS